MCGERLSENLSQNREYDLFLDQYPKNKYGLVKMKKL